MDIILLIKAFVIGVIEGLTEFLPVSSTGHMIIAGDILSFNDELGKTFEIVIQLGAILAICWEYRDRLLSVTRGLGRESAANRFLLNLFIAFLPVAFVGLLFNKSIKAHLFQPFTVAIAFIIGGVIIFLVEKRPHARPRIQRIEDMSGIDALKVGLAQVLSLIPGTSRSGATIIGGMVFGLSRKAATEFSFFLAIPVMFAASFYDLAKHWNQMDLHQLSVFAVGFVTAFISAYIATRALIRFVTNHTFMVFAWYRIVFGILLLIWYRNDLFMAL